MFTSRAEFRLHLRIDNADRRLTPYGRRVGLIRDDAWQDYLDKQQRMAELKKMLESKQSRAGQADDMHLHGIFADLLKRPEITIESLLPVLRTMAPEFFAERTPRACSVADHSVPVTNGVVLQAFAPLPRGTQAGPIAEDSLSPQVWAELKSVETEIKYAGYLSQQQKAMERLKKAEQRVIPDWFDYAVVSGLSREMKEKLQRVRPRTIGQASRIPGVTPAAVSLVNVYIEIQARKDRVVE
jgi:tRNA uridine 5-carboxymethylaminomethyl modification enzyme